MAKHRPRSFPIAVSVVSLAVCLMVSGCMDRIEPQKMSVILGIGVDLKDDGNIQVTAQVYNTSAATTGQTGQRQGQNKQYLILEGQGKTMEEAFQKLFAMSPRRIFFSHNAILVFGSDLAKKGFMQTADYFIRSREFRRAHILTVTSKKAGELLRSFTGVEGIPSRGLFEMLAEQKTTSISLESNGLFVTNHYLSPSHSVVMSWVDVDAKQEAVVKGLGVFRGDRLDDLFSEHNARGILWFLGKVKHTQFVYPCKEAKDSITGTMVELNKSNVKIVPSVSNSTVHFYVQVRGEGALRSLCAEERPSESMLDMLEKKLSETIEMEMKQSLTRLQEHRTDAVQFGKKIFEENPLWWRKNAKRWQSIFPNVQVTYDVQVKILRTGMIYENPKSIFTPENIVPKLEWKDE